MEAEAPDAAAVRFAVIGDFGIAGDRARDVSLLVKSWNVDFIITTGDNNYPNGAAATIDANIGQYYSRVHLSRIRAASDRRPRGTASSRRSATTIGKRAGAAPYLDYFTLPGNERYYDFVRGPVHFFAIDSDPHEPDGNSQSSVQGQWLQTRLARPRCPTASSTCTTRRSRPGRTDRTRRCSGRIAAWGASAVMAGHDHTYERIMRDGMPYFVNGAGGFALYAFRAPVAGSAVRFNGDYGAMLVEVDQNGATFRFFTRGGTLVDTHVVAPR